MCMYIHEYVHVYEPDLLEQKGLVLSDLTGVLGTELRSLARP